MLKVKSLNKKFNIGKANEVSVLNDISLSFPEKGLFVILGPSGSGKSTFLSLLGGLDTPTSGEILFNDKNINSLNEKERNYYRQQYVSFIFQENNLIDYLSLEDNALIKADKKGDESDEVLKKLGIYDLKKKRPSELSGGEKERCAIARAILSTSKIVLCDEPTSSLDSKNAEVVLSLLKDVSDDKLVIVVSHNEELCKKFTSNIIRIKDGYITDGPHYEEKASKPIKVVSSSIYKKHLFKRSGKHATYRIRQTVIRGVLSTIAFFSVATIVALADGTSHMLNKSSNEFIHYSPLTVSSYYENLSNVALLSDYKSKDTTGIKVWQESDITASLHKNIITDDFVRFLTENPAKNTYFSFNSDIDYSIIYQEKGIYQLYDNQTKDTLGDYVSEFFGKKSLINELLYEEDYFKTRYDWLYGRFPQNKNEAVFVLFKKHGLVSDATHVLGVNEGDDPQVLLDKTVFFPNYSSLYQVTDSKPFTGRFLKDHETLVKEGKDVRSINNHIIKYINEFYEGNVEEQEKAMEAIDSLFKDDKETRTLNAYSKIQSSSKLEKIIQDGQGEEIKIVGVAEMPADTNFEEKCTGLLVSPELLSDIRKSNSESPISQEMDSHLIMEEGGLLPVPSIVGYTNTTTKYTSDSLVDYLLKFMDYYSDRSFFSANNETTCLEIYAPNIKTREQYIAKIEQYNKDKDYSSELKYFDLTKKLLKYVNSYYDVIKTSMYAISIVTLIITMILSTALIFDMINSRVKEIGIYRASGYSSLYIFALIEIESVIVGVISGILGVGLSLISIPIVNTLVQRSITSLVITNFLYMKPIWIAAIIGASLVASFLSALAPSLIYSKKKPAEIIK